MTTDQIQTKLFEKADAATKAEVAAILKPVAEWVAARAYGEKISIRLSDCSFFTQDGVVIRFGQEDETPLWQKLDRGHIKVSMSDVMKALKEAMFNKLQGPTRTMFVEGFIADVERLKEEVEDLQSRVE